MFNMRKLLQGSALAALLFLVGCLGLGSIALPVYAGGLVTAASPGFKAAVLKILGPTAGGGVGLLDASGSPAAGDLTDGAAIGAGTLDAEEVLDVTGDATRHTISFSAGTEGGEGGIFFLYPVTEEAAVAEVEIRETGISFTHTTGPILFDGTEIKLNGDVWLQEGAAPATPDANKVALFAKSDGLLYSLDDQGTEVLLGGAGTWTSFSVVSTWVANVTWTGYYRLVGQSMEVIIEGVLTGAPTSATLVFDLPDTYAIDTAKNPLGTFNLPVGLVGMRDEGTDSLVGTVFPSTSDDTKVVPLCHRSDGTFTTAKTITEAQPFVWAATDRIGVTFSVPVVPE